jgi:hypothetical protein
VASFEHLSRRSRTSPEAYILTKVWDSAGAEEVMKKIWFSFCYRFCACLLRVACSSAFANEDMMMEKRFGPGFDMLLKTDEPIPPPLFTTIIV